MGCTGLNFSLIFTVFVDLVIEFIFKCKFHLYKIHAYKFIKLCSEANYSPYNYNTYPLYGGWKKLNVGSAKYARELYYFLFR